MKTWEIRGRDQVDVLISHEGRLETLETFAEKWDRRLWVIAASSTSTFFGFAAFVLWFVVTHPAVAR